MYLKLLAKSLTKLRDESKKESRKDFPVESHKEFLKKISEEFLLEAPNKGINKGNLRKISFLGNSRLPLGLSSEIISGIPRESFSGILSKIPPGVSSETSLKNLCEIHLGNPSSILPEILLDNSSRFLRGVF